MKPPTLVFLGSFLEYSATVLAGLLADSHLKIVAVITTPPHPQGRHRVMTKNPVHQLADRHQVPVFTPDKLTPDVLQDLTTALGTPPDLIVTAGYGKLLPVTWLQWPQVAALNLHFSLLPKYRGANPAEWALLCGETETGVSVIEMSPEFDAGQIVAQAPGLLASTATRETVYQQLYQLGSEVLPTVLTRYTAQKTGSPLPPNVTLDTNITYFSPPQAQTISPTPYARRLNREDGFVSWSAIQAALAGTSFSATECGPGLQEVATYLWPNSLVPPLFLERACRALAGFPSLWTLVPTAKGEKRLKILHVRLGTTGTTTHLEIVLAQLEGQGQSQWAQLRTAIVN